MKTKRCLALQNTLCVTIITIPIIELIKDQLSWTLGMWNQGIEKKEDEGKFTLINKEKIIELKGCFTTRGIF